MSLSKSFKRGGHRCDDSPEAGPSKRDNFSSDEDDEPAQRKGLSHSSSKISKQGGNMSKKSPGISKQQSGGHGHHNKPAELFRKDLISAMKLADTEILYDDEYFTILDPWRQEWEKGVQVPVNEEEIPPITILDVKNREKFKDFKMHPRKYLHEKSDETYQSLQHELTGMQELSEQIVRYDLDDMDVTWLEITNADREEMGLQVINEWNLERMIEELENQCYAKTNAVKKTEEGLGIEYDEDIACDVCRQLESEDTNEMVFCDGCDICVHQACYGIQTIPEGSWLCRICALGIKPMCLLCPKRGGAMKSTKSGSRWTHVSCALWIPEVSIGCPEKMEPVTKISNIPASRWALVCCLCKERVGACIQCSVKQCKTAFHVTCGFANYLDMKTILDDTDELDGIHLRAYCPKHTKNRNASDSDSPKKTEEEEAEENENDVSEVEMAKQRAEKLKQLEEEFYTLVDEQEISTKFFIPEEAVSVVTAYWKLKRKVNFNKPLITPKVEEENQMQKQQKDSLSARMKMFVHLRQDLERARNLCYMIGKREKTKKQLFKLQESVFNMQVNVLTDPKLDLDSREAEGIRHFFHFDSIYSSFCHKVSVSKLPRKNLFTLENLKTPKDLDEERNSSFEAVIKKKLSKKMKHSKHSKHSKQSSVKKEVKEEPATSDVLNVKAEKNAKEQISDGDDKNNKFANDTACDSSDNDLTHYDGSRTDSAQMSHLGKVKGSEEIVMDESKEEEPCVKEEAQEVDASSNKRTTGSDLKMKLTSILQSKSLKQKQDKLSQSDHMNSALYIDVENSDNDVFSSESNTDFASPIQQSRNLFDKFKVKEQWSSSDHASPDIPQKDSSRHKKGKRRHRDGSKKYKQSKLVLSVSERSDVSKTVDTKGKSPSCSDNRNIFDIGKEDASLKSPTTVTDSSDSDVLQKKNKVRDCSPSKLSFHKKKSSKDWSINTSCEGNPSQSTKHKKMSPSPRVDPDNVYATMDGDIYIPSGKIQVTERTIVLESPKEAKTKHSNKLRLKKQTNSPVKGVISYEVVNNDFDERGDIFIRAKEKKGVVPEVEDKGGDVKNTNSEIEDTKEKKICSDKKTSEKKVKEGKYGKLLSDSDGNISVELKESAVEAVVRKDLFGISESQSVNQKEKDRKLKRSSRNKERNLELESSSDENFVPSNKSAKLSAPNKPYRPQRECRPTFNSKPVIKPFPNRPDLNALVDPCKLIVKEPLKRMVGDKLSQIVRSRTRWGNRFNPEDRSQQTLDSFVKKSDKRFLSERDEISPLVRPDLKSPTITRSLLNGPSPNKFLVANGDVLQRTPSKNIPVNNNRLSSGYLEGAEDLSHNSSSLFVDGKNVERHIDDDVLSISSVASRLSNSEVGGGADTPRRSSRNRGESDEPPSPHTPSRLRNRDGLAKPSPLKLS